MFPVGHATRCTSAAFRDIDVSTSYAARPVRSTTRGRMRCLADHYESNNHHASIPPEDDISMQPKVYFIQPQPTAHSPQQQHQQLQTHRLRHASCSSSNGSGSSSNGSSRNGGGSSSYTNGSHHTNGTGSHVPPPPRPTTVSLQHVLPARDSSALRGRFQIPAAEVRRIVRDHQITLEELLLQLLQPAAMLARPYISGFRVAAVGVGGSGAIYVGVNVEFPGTSLNNSIHAEQCLLVNCLHHKEAEIKLVAVSAAPCGHCRQFYSELANADSIQFMFGRNARPRLLDDLLPLRFALERHDYNGVASASGSGGMPPTAPQLLQPQNNSVAFKHSEQVEDLVHQCCCGQHDTSCCGLFHEAASEALTEAIQSYAPYTQCPSGVAIITTDGQIYSGAYIESSAYNPSLSPFHAAVVAGIADQMSDYSQICEVILTELHDAGVQHADSICVLLRAVAPKARLTVLPLCRVEASVAAPAHFGLYGDSEHGGLGTV